MDDLDDILERSTGNDFYHLSDDAHEANDLVNNKNDDDILGLDKELKVKTRKKLVTLNDEKLLSKDGLPYLYSHRKKMKYLTKNKSDYNPKDFTTHYTYKNLSTILEFYQLWAHKLFPKLRFADAIYLANRKSAGESKNVRYFRERLVEQEMNELFPDETIDVSARVDDIDLALSDVEVNRPTTSRVDDIEADSNEDDASLVPHSNGLFVGDDDEDENLYTVSNALRVEPPAPEPSLDHGNSETNDPFDDGDEMDDEEEELIGLLNKRKKVNNTKVIEGYPDPDDVQDYESEMDVLREMGM